MVICASCQSQNSPKAKFCVKCGAGLRREDIPAQTQPAEVERPREPEKPVALKTGKRGSKRIDALVAKLGAEAPLVVAGKRIGQSDAPLPPPPALAVTEAPKQAEVSDVAP